MSRLSQQRPGSAARQPAGVVAALLAAGTLLAVTGPARAQDAAAPSQEVAPPRVVAGEWTPKELRFVYQGFTTHYSCDGLRDKVRQVLLDLGARPDLSVREFGCSGRAGEPDPFPGVAIKMHVMKPADERAMLALQTVPARWKSVNLRPNRDALANAGDCELIEQVKQRLLPLFATRNVDYSSNCVPHTLSVGGTRLRAEVLVSAAPPGTGTPPAAKAH